MAYLGPMTDAPHAELPYRLDPHAPPRAGGMGEVLFGHHPGTGLPVAVKRLPSALARSPEARAAFVREVRHTARLCHPNIVALDDFGFLTPADGPAWPWLAMDRADGALDGQAPVRDWETLRALLAAVLRGLAHAHALGLVHLDLKPSNILVFTAGGLPPRWALADFGIARLYVEPGTPWGVGAGTPAYMAPEQFTASHGTVGPSTDLYAVGCLVHALTTGRPPFFGGDRDALARAHLGLAPPPLPTGGHLPPGLATLVAHLLAKRPDARPDRAADVLARLLELPSPGPVAGTSTPTAGQPPTPWAPTAAATMHGTETSVAGDGSPTAATAETWVPGDASPATPLSPTAAAAPEPIDPRPPPVPTDWRAPERAGWRPWAPGPGLFPLRRLPLVGREAERDGLWGALRQVAQTRRPRVVVLDGTPGVGKSALLDWLGERAHETGAAVVLGARAGGRSDVLSFALARAIGATEGDDPVRLAAKARAALTRGGASGPTPADLAACVEMAGQDVGAAGRSSTMLPTLEARFATLRRLFVHLAGSRVCTLLIDDADAAPAALGFAEHLLRAPAGDVPVLCVLARRGRDMQPGAPTPAGGLLDELCGRPGVSVLAPGPLTAAETTHLVRTLLGLAPALAARLEAASRGNPGAAVARVSSWIAAGRLRRGRHGAVLTDDDAFDAHASGGPDAPEDPAASVGDVLARLATALADDAGREALALAACLDAPFTRAELGRCLDAADGTPALDACLDALLERGLLVAEPSPPERLRFSTPALPAALRARLAPTDRAACHARLADRLGPTLGPAALGAHRIAAGTPDLAIEPLLAGLRAALTLADTRTAAVLLPLLRAAARPRPDDDPVHTEALLLEARLSRARGALGTARAATDEALARAPVGALAAEVSLERGRIAWNTGDIGGARGALERAWTLAREAQAPRLAADARRVLGLVLLHGGDRAAAEAHFEAARRAYEAADEPVWAATCVMNVGVAARQGDEPARARAAVLEARARHAAAGARWGVAECENELGELARAAGDWAAAADHYAQARAINDALGSGDAIFNELNLALVHLEAGDPSAASLALIRGRDVLEAQGRMAFAAAVRVLALAASTLAEPASAAPTGEVEAAARDLSACGLVDPDVARWTARARDAAAQADRPDLATAFDGIHRAQQAALGRSA